MKGNGFKTPKAEQPMKSSLMTLFIKAHMRRESQTEKASLYGKTDNSTKDNGKTAWRTARVFGEALRVTLTLASGEMAKRMDMVSTHGSMEIDTKANSKSVSSTDRVWTNLQMETPIKGSMSMDFLMERESTAGLMEASFEVSLRQA
jgi:hypothetical protein